MSHNLSMAKILTAESRPRYYFREWRKFRGYNQEALAELVGVTPSSISQLESGKQGFTDTTLAAMAAALKCHPGELLMRDPTRADSFWPLFEKAEKLEGKDRDRLRAVILASLE